MIGKVSQIYLGAKYIWTNRSQYTTASFIKMLQKYDITFDTYFLA